MTVAEIHGKISDTGTKMSERMEDLLNSDIFGCMRYLAPEEALLPFLCTARSLYGDTFAVQDKITKVHYSFWPRLRLPGRIPCEPDVVIGLETEGCAVHVAMVEAKYYSGLSSEGDERPEPNDQLAREFDNLDVVSPLDLGWEPMLDIVSRTLILVTQDMGIPHRLLAQSLAEYKRKRGRDGDIFWASWRFLPFILEQNLQENSSSGNMAVLEDMLRLLLRKDLTMFRGVEPVNKYITVPEFYTVSPRRYSWPDMPESMGLDYAFEVIENDSRQGESNQGSV